MNIRFYAGLIIIMTFLSAVGCGGAGAGDSTGLSITTTTLPAGNVNVPYSATVVAKGGKSPYTWSIKSGNLPTGLSLNSSTGEVAGTPTVAIYAEFTITVEDSGGNARSKLLAIDINRDMLVKAEITVVRSDWPEVAGYDLVLELDNQSQTVHLTSSALPITVNMMVTRQYEEFDTVRIKATVIPPGTINGGSPAVKYLYASAAWELRNIFEENDFAIDVWPGRPSPYLTVIHTRFSAVDVH